MPTQRRIIVSIDFGTTYSGVAWAESSQPDVQHIISKWPSADGTTSSPKVPTELRRVANGWQWGFQIPTRAKRLRLFKLKLDDPSSSMGEGESPQQLTKIFLGHLHDHFLTVLEETLSPAVVRSTPMDFIVTVPAIWSPAAKQATERAAAMAGFCSNRRIILVSEPEAAALYTLQTRSLSRIKRGQKYIICDAGGGTVDLITYEVTDSDRMVLKEVTEGTGGRCGSSMLNQRFRRHLKQQHSERHWSDERLVHALNEFEGFKKTFTAQAEPLALRVDPALGLRRNRYVIPKNEMRTKIFEPIIKDIICLVEEQISMAEGQITAIILVGGFGQSDYLKTRIQEAIKRGIPVLRPRDGWSAVVRGAVIHGLNLHHPVPLVPRIASRVARRSYGTCLLTKYNMLIHDPKEAFWDEKEEEMMVFVMLWFIEKGKSYREDGPSSIDYQCDIPVHLGKAPQTEIEIFVNEDDKPPRHLDNRTRCIAVLSLDVPSIPTSVKRQASIQRMGGFRYFSIPGVIQATYGSALVTYSAQLGGIMHDRIRIDYER